MTGETQQDRPRERTARPAATWGAPEVLLVVFFGALVAVAPTRLCLWIDELSSVHHAWDTLRAAALSDPAHPPAYYACLWAWIKLFGQSDLSVRLSSVLPAALAMAVALALTRRLVSRTGALIGGLLLAVSPFCLLYCRMVRYFSLVLLVAPLFVWLLLRARDRCRWVDWIACGVSAAAVAYSDYVAAMVVVLMGAWFLLRHRSDRALLRGALVAAAVALALYTPWLGVLYEHTQTIQARSQMELQGSVPGLAVELLLPYYSLAIGQTTDFWQWPVVLPGLTAFGLLGWAGLRSLWRAHREEAAWALWVVVGGPLAATGVMSTISRQTPVTRSASLVIYIAPVAYALVARGALGLRPVWRAVGLGVLFVVSGYGVANYFRGQQFLNPSYCIDWRAITSYVQQRESPADLVLTVETPFVHYYRGRAQHRWSPVDVAGVPRVRVWAAQVERMGGRVWIVRRDRGFRQLVEVTDLVRREFETLGWRGAREGFEPQGPTSLRYREKLLRRPVSPYYVEVWRYDPPGTVMGKGTGPSDSKGER